MDVPIVLTGVIHGKTITLDDTTFLPDGYRVKLHLIIDDPEEAIRLACGAWADMTPEEVKDFEEMMTEFDGTPFEMPEPDPS